MNLKNFAVINHPVRMRIFQALNETELSINQLAQRLSDVPRPSIYRHIHQMLDAGVIRVARTRLVNGIEERFYIAERGLIDPADLERPGGLQEFVDHVRLYGCGVAQELGRYVLERGEPDLNNIAARDHVFYATEEEFVRAREAIYKILQALEAQPPAEGRRKRRMFIMGHPLWEPPE
ncbi:MAG: helix-turn-helix domain-containing protein [Anaerolineales bacterium]|nr:helix-turn-helix domain-containing protein [Anaerolineales bacterium]MDW8163023.1 helix-turn-helix domain-containing protein [Anaerolineales bacterium]